MAASKGKARAVDNRSINHGRPSLVVDDSDEETPVSNGAAASQATERTRLLADEASGSPASARSQRISARLRASPSGSIGETVKRRRCRNVRWGRLILVTLIVILALIVVALGVAYAVLSSRLDGAQEMAERGVRIDGPNDIRFKSLSDDGRELKLEVDMRAGIDSRAALDDETLPKWLVRWATRQVGSVKVSVDGDVEVDGKRQTLVSIPSVPEMRLPLNYGSLDPLYWLANLTIPVTIRLVAAPGDLLDFANASYHAARARVDVKVASASASIKLLGIPIGFGVEDLSRALRFDIPQVDVGEPKDLVRLGKYSVHVDNSSVLLDASATGLNPLANGTILDGKVPQQVIDIISRTPISLPWSLRFVAALPPIVGQTEALPIAHVDVQPPHLSSAFQPSVRVTLNGTALPPPKDDDVPGTDAQLSSFLGNYLDGRKSRVQVSYARTEDVPTFVADLLASIPAVELEIPGKANDEPILGNVTIAHVRIGTTPDGDNMACSGIVRGRLNLPAQFANLSSVLRISRVWPDVLVRHRRCRLTMQVFDGPPERSTKRIKHWPPENPPERVFARLTPSDWLPAQSVIEDGETWVVANMSDVALRILDGRGAVFRSYVRKQAF